MSTQLPLGLSKWVGLLIKGGILQTGYAVTRVVIRKITNTIVLDNVFLVKTNSSSKILFGILSHLLILNDSDFLKVKVLSGSSLSTFSDAIIQRWILFFILMVEFITVPVF